MGAEDKQLTRLGSYLISKGEITEEQLENAFRGQLVFGGRIGTTLVELGLITEKKLGEALSEILGVPYATFQHLQDIPADVLGLVPPNLAATYKVVPFRVEEKSLHLAMMAPNDLLVQDEVSFLTELRVHPWVAPEIRILEALDRYYKVSRERRFIALTGELNLLTAKEKESSEKKEKEAIGKSKKLEIDSKPSTHPEIGLDGRPIHEPEESPFLNEEVRSPAETLAKPVPPSSPPSNLEAWRTESKTAVLPEPVAKKEKTDSTQTMPTTDGGNLLEEAANKLAHAESRDEVARIVLDFTRTKVRRAGLFILQKDQALTWHWSTNGDDGGEVGLKGVSIPLNTPSMFSPFRSLKTHYLGPVAPLPANREFFSHLKASLPRVAVILPIPIQGKVAVLLYGDNEGEGLEKIDLNSLQRISRKASAALEILILKNKIRMF